MYDLREYEQRRAEVLSRSYSPSIVNAITSAFNDIAYGRKKKLAEDPNTSFVVPDNTLVNLENYGPYQPIARGERMSIDVSTIDRTNWDLHYRSILNIFKDGIYTDYIHSYFIGVNFEDGLSCELSLVDYYFNLIMWRLIIFLGKPIRPWHIFFEHEFRARSIKAYVDEFVIEPYIASQSNAILSQTIANSLHYYHDVDDFSGYLCNTLNLEDSAALADADPVFYKALHNSYTSLQVDQVNDAIMKDAQVSIECIRNAKDKLGHDHCLVDVWRTNEGINPKQNAEFSIAIGVKPDGRGGIFPHIVNASFIGGGLVNPVDYFIESSTSRIAQIEKHKNVSKSGVLARIMTLNNNDTMLYPDDTFDCHSPNLIKIEVKTSEHLKCLNMRYYRLTPNGQEKCINAKTDKFLVGKTIYIRSPITCASHARGHGVCRKCYGKLAYAVHDYAFGHGVNIGGIASELITSKQTQKQLSAKHILKASIDKIEWSIDFYSIFEMENTVVRLSSDIENPKDYVLLIDQDAIESDAEFEGGEGEDDSGESDSISSNELDEYVTEFNVLKKSTGEVFHITTESSEKLFITNELNAIIRNRAVPTDDRIAIPVSALKEHPLFTIRVRNNEINKILLKLKNLFDRTNEVKGKTIHEHLQDIIDTNIEGDMGVSAIHYEVLLSNQIRDPDDVLERPNWDILNPPYRILTLDEALMKNPSVTISLSYQKITKSLYNPTTFRKVKAGWTDAFFHEHPQMLFKDITAEDVVKKRQPGELYEPLIVVDDMNRITAEDPTCDDDGTLVDVEE